LIGLFWASLKVQPAIFEYVEDVANSDNPVTHLKRDILGYRAMVLRLLLFIQNENTAAPLVLSIQAAWGMGKSSVMRMLQSELQSKRTAAAVWFNAWHHQKEDQLLAYLLEAIQKQVAPSWFSAVGLGFRFNLLRVRMLASVERFLAVLISLALLIFHSQIARFFAVGLTPWVGHRPDTLSLVDTLSSAIPLSFAAGILLNQTRAFSADPQKLLESSTKSAWRFLRDLFLFPSLQGKTDVRHEFEKNLREVTDALRPQRLVIFLDDLDRCRPEQVVQILEAINFLSSAAPCFIVVGADYHKVETLVGMQFEQLSIQEQQNAGVEKPDAAKTRLAYARSYMKKIVNIRVNLPRPAMES
jgi:KAP family P-loop domain